MFDALYIFPFYLIIMLEGVIFIDIEIKKPNHFRNALRNLHSKLEDMMFSLIQKIPEKFLTASLMNWLDHYTTKRINELKQEHIKNTWKKMYLEKAVEDISKRQQN